MNLVAGNRITLLKNGAEFFPALEAAIDRAQKDIRLETYIFENDVTGARILAALTRAASRGVAVRVLIDGIGSKTTPRHFFAPLEDARGAVLTFRPERKLLSFRKSRLRRIHRKVVLIDGCIGFVGGINIIDDMTESLSEFPRYDYAVQIEGPLLAEIYPSVHLLWRRVATLRLRRSVIGEHAIIVPTTAVGTMNAAFVMRDNFRHRRDIENAYLAAIQNATQEILLVNPYFLPGRKMRQALRTASARGVTVTVLLQGRADHALLQWATRALYAQFLGAGINIAEYHRSMLHGKVAVIDMHWATVGSSNLDPFSLFLNREANIVVLDTAFAATLRESIQQEIALGATQCAHEEWSQRSLFTRLGTWAAYTVARWASGIVGIAKEWG